MSSLVGNFANIDESTRKKARLDVARVMIMASSQEAINKVLRVKINDHLFSIRMVEDTFRFSAYSLNSDYVVHQRIVSPSVGLDSDEESSTIPVIDFFGELGYADNFEGNEEILNSLSCRVADSVGVADGGACNLPAPFVSTKEKYSREGYMSVEKVFRMGGSFIKVSYNEDMILEKRFTEFGPDCSFVTESALGREVEGSEHGPVEDVGYGISNNAVSNLEAPFLGDHASLHDPCDTGLAGLVALSDFGLGSSVQPPTIVVPLVGDGNAAEDASGSDCAGQVGGKIK